MAERGKPDLANGAEKFEAELWLGRPITEVFEFFSNAANLQCITPNWLDFSILTPNPIPMRVGALIDYRLRIHGIPVRWRTRISAWEPPFYFADEQLKGPYRLWFHEHYFRPVNDGTSMIDRVHFRVPGGRLVSWLFVRRDVEKIFAFRRKELLRRFG